MSIRTVATFTLLLVGGTCVSSAAVLAADDAQAFIEVQHHRIESLLRRPGSDAEVNRALAAFVDYDALTHRAFGDPCPASEPDCEDLWTAYSDAQRSELRDLLEKLVRKNYERNLRKTLDYDVTYRGSHEGEGGTRVMTEAKNRNKPREAPVRVDYVVFRGDNGFKVVDIVTEGSSLTKNYYDQFRRKMHDPNDGYAGITAKLRQKLEEH
jgi:phospholipid transport system substrate-binding protein